MRYQRAFAIVVVAGLGWVLAGCATWNLVKAEEQVSEAEDLEKKEDFAGAADLYQAAVHYVQKGYPDGCDEEIIYRSHRSSCLLRAGRPKDAMNESKDAVALARRLHDANHPSIGVALVPYAAALNVLGLHEEARAAGDEIQRIQKAQPR